ncbi:MAG TPA: hypothetical protein DCP40_10800, partial [Stenotrophomonas sp.]|nr:hypothetical protein [Stenotrophomonas sp.]
ATAAAARIAMVSNFFMESSSRYRFDMGVPASGFQRCPFYPFVAAEAEPQACKIAFQTAHLRVAPSFRT